MPIRRLLTPVVVLLALVGLGTVLTVFLFAVPLAGLAQAAWRPPVEGAVTRAFDPGSHPFEGGRHRGVDLAAATGAPVRAPCGGRVAFAGEVGKSGRVVTLRCGSWRVTHLPLATIAALPGAAVEPGDLLGTVAASEMHRGLHLGVRREGTRFGYADPLRFLAARPAPPPPLGPAPRPARRPRAAPPRPPAARPPAPRTARPAPRPGPSTARPPARVAPSAARRPAAPATSQPDSNRGAQTPFAPWPAWLGLALVLAGAGLRLRGRAPTIRGRPAAAGTLTR